MTRVEAWGSGGGSKVACGKATGRAAVAAVAVAVAVLAATLAADPVCAQAPPPSPPPPGAPPPSAGPGEEQPQDGKFLKAYRFKPFLYWGAGLGLDYLPDSRPLCPDGMKECIGVPLGVGFEFHMGARFHYLFGLELTYDSFFFSEKKDAYHQATLQSVRLDAHVYLLAGANLEVYLLAGGGIGFVGDKYSIDGTGAAFEAGAGLDFVPNPSFTVGIVAQYKGRWFGKHPAPFNPDPTIDGKSTVDAGFLHGVELLLNLQFRYVLVVK